MCNDSPPLALLAGGLASRLGDLTARLPKSLLPVAGVPFIAHQLRLLSAQGIRDVVVCCGHLGEQIENLIGNGSQFDCTLHYSYDGPTLLGTGGAIRKALPLLGSCFWMMYGDSYLTAPFAPVLDFFRGSGLPALMTVFANSDRWDASNVLFRAGKVLRYDKNYRHSAMRHIDYGLAIFSAAAFEPWPENSPFDLSALQSSLVEEGRMAGYEVAERFYEIGSLRGLQETDSFLTKHRCGISA